MAEASKNTCPHGNRHLTWGPGLSPSGFIVWYTAYHIRRKLRWMGWQCIKMRQDPVGLFVFYEGLGSRGLKYPHTEKWLADLKVVLFFIFSCIIQNRKRESLPSTEKLAFERCDAVCWWETDHGRKGRRKKNCASELEHERKSWRRHVQPWPLIWIRHATDLGQAFLKIYASNFNSQNCC